MLRWGPSLGCFSSATFLDRLEVCCVEVARRGRSHSLNEPYIPYPTYFISPALITLYGVIAFRISAFFPVLFGIFLLRM